MGKDLQLITSIPYSKKFNLSEEKGKRIPKGKQNTYSEEIQMVNKSTTRYSTAVLNKGDGTTQITIFFPT